VSALSIPAAQLEGAAVRVVAGEYAGIRGPVTEIAAQPLYMDVTLEPGAAFALPVPAGHFALAYVFEGEGLFGLDEAGNGDYVPAVRMLVFDDGDTFRAQAGAGAPLRFMLMAGAPFREPIFPYGPFVMSTAEEIQQALQELRNGTFVQNSVI